MTVTELEEFQRRVETYFNVGQPREPAGRLILDLLRALKMCPVDNDKSTCIDKPNQDLRKP